MRKSILFAAMIFLITSRGYSQVDETVNKVNNTIYEANKANETFGKLKGLLPKKKSKAQSIDSSAKVVPKVNDTIKKVASDINITILKIVGIDYATLKKLQGNIQVCEGVQEAKMRFSADSSSIEIKHKGTTEAILSNILLTSKDVFSEENIAELEEGKVSLNLKK